jgi:hypothetical protein
MTICISANFLDTRSIYPVLDPRRTAGSGGVYQYVYNLAWDGLQIDVQRNATLSNCTMDVRLASTLTEFKEIQAWNIFADNFVDRVGSSGLGLPNQMTITRAWGPRQSCGAGTDTVVLCRHFAWPRGRTALYTLEPLDFWDFWGGCTVTFNWLFDNIPQGNWGNQTPAPTYPLVRLPDRTLMRDGANFRVVFGGTDFAVTDPAYLTAMNFDTNSAIPGVALPRFPADGTLLRDSDQPEVFVVYGGAKFWITNPETLFALGFDWSQVNVVPPGGTSKLGAMPINGTLIKERCDPKVFYSDGNALRWVTSPAAMDNRCFAWRHVRTVPDNALAPLPRGPDLT